MKIAIVGCGLIGEKRAKTLGKHDLVIVSDKEPRKALQLSRRYGKKVIVAERWQEAAGHPDVDLVIAATTNDSLVPVSLYALKKGKHVLVEKPAARSAGEIRALLKAEKLSKKKVKAGFNLRFHPAVMKAREIVDSGGVGELMFIRGRYGHGGRIGYDKEWRADPEIAGGGELLDQGVHLIDLSRWFLGDFTAVEGFVNTYFWEMPVEDNGFMCLRTKKGRAAWLHASCTEWKNMFCFEIYGKTGKLQIDGLGGSYGTERLSYYRMLPEMGPPETTIWEYPTADNSWQLEFDHFEKAIRGNTAVSGGLRDAEAALEVVGRIYGRTGK